MALPPERGEISDFFSFFFSAGPCLKLKFEGFQGDTLTTGMRLFLGSADGNERKGLGMVLNRFFPGCFPGMLRVVVPSAGIHGVTRNQLQIPNLVGSLQIPALPG